MKLVNLSTNFHKLVIADGQQLYFSYETLVAIMKGGKNYITPIKYSKTTSKHINTIFGEVCTEEQWNKYTSMIEIYGLK